LVTVFLPGVDHLDQLPAKAAFLFHSGGALDSPKIKADPENATILESDLGQRVIGAFAMRAIAEPGPITPERFKALMNEIKAETGAKGKDLFHPVRIMLTGAHSGPEFDKIIPLMEDGAALGLGVKSVAERATAAF
jgi:glutamyl/glutaminyl-tRNA synthetase